jgi:hypothetical protein
VTLTWEFHLYDNGVYQELSSILTGFTRSYPPY